MFYKVETKESGGKRRRWYLFYIDCFPGEDAYKTKTHQPTPSTTKQTRMLTKHSSTVSFFHVPTKTKNAEDLKQVASKKVRTRKPSTKVH